MIDLIQINQRFFGGKFPACSINGKDIAYLSVGSSIDLSAVFFEQCFFDILQIEEARDNDVFPQFRNCIINSVLGCSSRNQMPPGMISDDTEVLSFFDNYDTNAQILRSDLAIEIALLVTVLRKLFVQRGRARKEGAFFRGIELHHRGKVSSILRIVVKHDFATLLPTASGAIYVPNYSLAAEALNILSKPAESRHILAREVRDL
jgi:hypothetical protein